MKYLFLLIVTLLLVNTDILAQITEVIDGGGVNTFDGPNVYSDANGNIYVSSSNTDNVMRIAASTTCTEAGADCTVTEIIDATGDGANIFDRGAAVAFDASGNVYVAGQFSDNVFRIANPTTCSTGGTPCTITEIIDSTGDGGGNGLDTPFSLTSDSSGNIYVAGAVTDNILRIAASTTCSTGGTPCTITEIIDATGDGTNAMDQPVGLTTDNSGNVYVTTQNSDNAFKISTPGTCSTAGSACTITEMIDATGDGSSAMDFGRGIVVDSNNNVYVSSIGFGNPSKVFKIDNPGTCSTLATPCTITEIYNMALPQQASGLAVDSADNIFVAGGNGDNVFRITTPTSCSTGGTPCTITEIADDTGDGTGDIGMGTGNFLDGPGTLTVVNDSDVYVAGGGSDNVFRVSGEAMPVELTSFSIE